MSIEHRLAVARGERVADLLFRGGRVANVFTAEIEEVDVAVADGWIVGLGPDYQAKRVEELDGALLLPGLIDAHVHIESSLATPPEFARAVVPRGTLTVISDPHEIANVHGLAGIEFMLEASEGIPLDVFVMASSCVPATPMGTAGAELEAQELATLLDHPRVLGLAEVMNFPGVIHGLPSVMAKIEAYAGRPIDGHAPGVRGRDLNAYVVGGPGSDHESTTAEEALEKIRRGLFLLFREATNARNLADLLPALTDANTRRVGLCTDDRQPPDLLDHGGIDGMIRTAIRSGVPPLTALRMATLNIAEHYGLDDRGAIAPGRRAHLLKVRDWESLDIERVWRSGSLVAERGVATWDRAETTTPPEPVVRVEGSEEEFHVPAEGDRIRVIGVLPDQLVTTHEIHEAEIDGDRAIAAPDRDILKIAVLERHLGTGRVGLGFVRGMGLTRGAIAGTVAHDHHNVIVIGVDDESMASAVREVRRLRGGLAAVVGQKVLASLALPVAGLMSAAPIERIREDLDAVLEATRTLGSPLHDPFMAMSFLGLEVIPTLKITDQGLIDVEAFEPVSLWV